ncbi:esterase [Opitutaceae bacterium EW11]|nr:esterase [Opitutaceae bacterium EW11]
MTKSAAPIAAPAIPLRLTVCCAVFFSFLVSSALGETLRDRIRERRAQKTELAAHPEESDETSPTLQHVPGNVRRLPDIAYGSDAAQRLDIYLPASTPPKNAPILFMVHGGGWARGDKAMQTVVENKVAHWVPRGFIFVSINYRLLPAARPLEQADDISRALAYVQTHAKDWGGNPESVVLMGHSAGAHLVALLAAQPKRAVDLGAKPWLGSVLLDSAALDVPAIMEKRHFRLYDPAFGKDPAYWKLASPYHLLTAPAQPVFAVCSSRRADSRAQARSFAAHAKSIGSAVTVHEEDKTHREINDELGLTGPYTEAVDAFLRSLSPSLAEELR